MKHHFVGGRFRVGGAIFLGICIVVGAYFLRGDVTTSTDLEDPRTFVAAVPLRTYQETKDTDGDGLRDWFEELSGTDPRENDANKPGSSLASPTSTPFVMDTETDKFAISFMETMLEANREGLTEAERVKIVDGSMRQFKALNEDAQFGRADIQIIADRSAEAIREYGNRAARPIVVHGENTEKIETELVLLGLALQEDDASHLKDLAFIKERYGNIVADLLKVPVPEPLIDNHLLLINSLQAMKDDVAGFQMTFEDPLLSYVRFKRYTSDVAGLSKAIEGVRSTLERSRIVYQNDEAGAFLFSLRP